MTSMTEVWYHSRYGFGCQSSEIKLTNDCFPPAGSDGDKGRRGFAGASALGTISRFLLRTLSLVHTHIMVHEPGGTMFVSMLHRHSISVILIWVGENVKIGITIFIHMKVSCMVM